MWPTYQVSRNPDGEGPAVSYYNCGHDYGLVEFRLPPNCSPESLERAILAAHRNEYCPEWMLFVAMPTNSGEFAVKVGIDLPGYPPDGLDRFAPHGYALYRRMNYKRPFLAEAAKRVPGYVDPEEFQQRRKTFRRALAKKGPMDSRVVAISGVPLSGKSALLDLLVDDAVKVDAKFVRADCQGVQTLGEVLLKWAVDLSASGLSLSEFFGWENRLRHLRALASAAMQSAVEKGPAVVAKQYLPDLHAYQEIALAAAGKFLWHATNTVADFLRRPENKDLSQDGSAILLERFLAGLAAARESRVVLFLDSVDQARGLMEHLTSLAGRLPAHVMLVVAGRKLPGWGSTPAYEWAMSPVSEAELITLINRYARMTGKFALKDDVVKSIAQQSDGRLGLALKMADALTDGTTFDVGEARMHLIRGIGEKTLAGFGNLRPVVEAAAAMRIIDPVLLVDLVTPQVARDALPKLLEHPDVDRVGGDGIVLRDRPLILDYLRTLRPEETKQMHGRLAELLDKRAEHTARSREGAWRCQLEAAYHLTECDEEKGLERFRSMAQSLVQLRLIGLLEELLESARAWPLRTRRAVLWVRYFRVQREYLRGRRDMAHELESISRDRHADKLLKANVFKDLLILDCKRERLMEPGGVERVRRWMKSSEECVAEEDAALVHRQLNFAFALQFEHKFDEALERLDRAEITLKQLNDKYEILSVLRNKKAIYAKTGRWHLMFEVEREAEELLGPLEDPRSQLVRVRTNWAVGSALAGRHALTERHMKEAEKTLLELGEPVFSPLYSDLAFVLGRERKFAESFERFALAAAGSPKGQHQAAILRYEGYVLGLRADLAQNDLEIGMAKLRQSLQIDGAVRQMALVWLGENAELRADVETALELYQEYLGTLQHTHHDYFESSSRVGLIRALYAKGERSRLGRAWSSAMELALRRGYDDHQAWLHLVKAHLTLSGCPDGLGRRFKVASEHYRQCLTHALRYNRFALDEMLEGRSGTAADGRPKRLALSVEPLVPFCLNRGPAGTKMLQQLVKWWSEGTVDARQPLSAGDSPIRAGIRLLEAEQTARLKEPGDGARQRTVWEVLTAALVGVI